MKINHFLKALLLASSSLASFNCLAEIKQTEELGAFITRMNSNHQFDKDELSNLFQSVEIKDSILKAISSPAEGISWFKYRKIFLTDKRINGGVKFWQDNEQALTAVQEQYGVPAEIIVAIIGVETSYGGNTGSYRVIDALSTLGFAYPKRSKFFTSELESFLLLCRDEKMDPLQPVGSYAGAMGMPQFMPSSYRAYAADYDGDGRHDIWDNNGDVIASVANYFVKHRWQPGQPIAYPVTVTGEAFKSALTKGLKPDITIEKLKSLNVEPEESLEPTEKVKLLSFKQEKGDEYWIGLKNFYVITRYNHSPLYAMAVYQLSQEILDKKMQIANDSAN